MKNEEGFKSINELINSFKEYITELEDKLDSYKNQCTKYENKIDNLTNEVKILDQQLTKRGSKEDIDILEEHLQAKDDELKGLDSILKSRYSKIIKQEEEINNLKELLSPQSASVSNIIKTNNEQANAIEKHYYELKALKEEIVSLQYHLDNLDRVIDNSEKVILQKDIDIEKLKVKNKILSDNFANTNTLTKEDEIKTLNIIIDTHNNKIAELKEVILQKDIDIEKLKDKNKILSDNFANTNTLTKEDEIKTLNIIIDTHNNKIAELKEVILQKDIDIEKLKDKNVKHLQALNVLSSNEKKLKTKYEKAGIKLPDDKELAEKLLIGFEFFGDFLNRINAKVDENNLVIREITSPFKVYSDQLRETLSDSSKMDLLELIRLVKTIIPPGEYEKELQSLLLEVDRLEVKWENHPMKQE